MVKTSVQEIEIFDRKLLKLRRARCAQNFSDADFLFQWTGKNLRERLEVIKREFGTCLQIGARGGKILDGAPAIDLDNAFAPEIIADGEFLPIAPLSLDLILSSLDLHTVNDLPGTLLQIRKSLKEDGLFIAALFGGETLHEFRASLSTAEMELSGGISPRIFPFADKQTLGGLLQRAGFALPVVDSEIITVTYDNVFKLMADLRAMGEGNIIVARDKRYVGKEFFIRAAHHYADNYSEPDGRIVASFEIIFLLGWSPHESQQKPLRPGSAKERLADALDTEETKL